MRAGHGLGRCGEGEGSGQMVQGEQRWEERWQGWGGMRWLVPPHRGSRQQTAGRIRELMLSVGVGKRTEASFRKLGKKWVHECECGAPDCKASPQSQARLQAPGEPRLFCSTGQTDDPGSQAGPLSRGWGRWEGHKAL